MTNNNNLRKWSARLEAGENDDELLALAARLERAGRNEPSTIPLDYRRQLRRELLTRYPATQAAGRRWRLVQTAAVLGGLALIVILTWFTMSSLQRSSFGGIAATAPTPFNIPTAPVMAAALGSYSVNAPDGLEAGRTLELLAYWHVPDDLGATGAFAQLLDDAGHVVAQSDGPLKDMGGEVYEVNLAVPLPAPLPNGGYTLVFGLSDATGARLPLYDFVQSTVVYEESASPLQVGSVEPAGDEATETAITPATSSSDSGYHLLGYSTNGGIVTETVETDDPANQTVTHLLVPGMTMTVTLNWNLPAEAAIVSAFVHLLDDDGQTVAQADAPVKAATGLADHPFQATLALNLPADLPAGEYDLVAGLYDPATGERLPLSTGQDQSMRVLLWGDYQVSDSASLEQVPEFSITDAQHDILHFRVLEAEEDALAVHEVSPPTGAAIGGAAPTEFVITVDYALKSLPQAILEVRVVEDLGNESGRGVGLATIDLTRGTGTTSVVVVVNPSTELAGAADLGVLLQLKPDAEAAPIVTVMPDNVGWPYRP